MEPHETLAQLGEELEGAERQRNRGGEDMRVDPDAVREKGSFHVRMDQASQRQEPIGKHRVGGDTEGEQEQATDAE